MKMQMVMKLKPRRRYSRPYIGVAVIRGKNDRAIGFKYELFRSIDRPTQETHGHLYGHTIGPFRTTLAAKAMIWFGHYGNPHYACVADAERLVKGFAAETLNWLKRAGTVREMGCCPVL